MRLAVLVILLPSVLVAACGEPGGGDDTGAGGLEEEGTGSTSSAEASSGDATGGTSRGGSSDASTSGMSTGGQLADESGGDLEPGSGSLDGSGSVGGTGAVDATDGASDGSGGSSSDDEVQQLLSEFAVYWDFEMVEGDSVLPAVGDIPLALDGAVTAAGPSGQQLTLSGEATSATTSGPIVDTAQSFSVAAWVALDRLDGYDTFMGADGETVSAFYLQKRDDDRLSFTTFPSDSTGAPSCVATAEIQPRAQEWYHVVGTWDAGTGDQRIYVDGVLSGKATCTAVFQASGGLSVGRGLYNGEPSDPWTGAVDDVGLLARVLTPAEVVTLYRHGRPDQENYLFAYFVEVSEGRGDGLRLAHSHDGLHWGAIGAGKVFMPPSVGGGSFRDPHLMRAPDGDYHLVWTTTCVPWAEANCVQDRGLGHATSPDLVTWSAADYITIDLNVEHVWAPETFYDEASHQFMVFWSSPLDQDPSVSDPHSIYYILTQDFRSFTEPEILYAQPGRNYIDATILDRGDAFLMVIKDEADGQKNLRALTSTALFGQGAWTATASDPITGNYAAEGPSFLQRQGQLYIYFDKYGEGAYGALEATMSEALDTPAAWRDISDAVFFPGVRHGTPIEVPPDVFRAVAQEAGR